VTKVTENENNPVDLFNQWMAMAEKSEPGDANAMALATTTTDGFPSVRMVLLKDVSDKGFVFYTNTTSRKGLELIANPNAALCFHWKSLSRQIRIEGPVETVDDDEADRYFHSRPRLSQIGAWASKQSQVLQGRFEFEQRIAKYMARFNVGEIPRPDFWTGFRVEPVRIEFWKDEKFRLHDRLVFERKDGHWQQHGLYP